MLLYIMRHRRRLIAFSPAGLNIRVAGSRPRRGLRSLKLREHDIVTRGFAIRTDHAGASHRVPELGDVCVEQFAKLFSIRALTAIGTQRRRRNVGSCQTSK